jgi:hypothetical protein
MMSPRLETRCLCGWLSLAALSLLLVVVGGALTGPETTQDYALMQYVGIGSLAFLAFVCLPMGAIVMRGRTPSVFLSTRGHQALTFEAERRTQLAAPVQDVECTYITYDEVLKRHPCY